MAVARICVLLSALAPRDLSSAASVTASACAVLTLWWSMRGFGLKVDSLESKLDRLGVRMDKSFKKMDKRFAKVHKRFNQMDQRFDALGSAMNTVLLALTRSPPVPIPSASAAAAAAALLPPAPVSSASSISLSLLLQLDHPARSVARRFEPHSTVADVYAWAATCVPPQFGRPFSLVVQSFPGQLEAERRLLRCARGTSLLRAGLTEDCTLELRWEGGSDEAA